jgi:hypothetical protein
MMNCEGCGKKRPWPTFKVVSNQFPGTEYSHEKPWYTWSRGRYLNPGCPDYEAEILITRPQRSVIFHEFIDPYNESILGIVNKTQ